ncbi:hypothetical protein Aph02nite_46350 [Actinoplanes philippinensis]|nr:hypothetical protein Aph02nite_46350 [Actinoplanes philippinensis]
MAVEPSFGAMDSGTGGTGMPGDCGTSAAEAFSATAATVATTPAMLAPARTRTLVRDARSIDFSLRQMTAGSGTARFTVSPRSRGRRGSVRSGNRSEHRPGMCDRRTPRE